MPGNRVTKHKTSFNSHGISSSLMNYDPRNQSTAVQSHLNNLKEFFGSVVNSSRETQKKLSESIERQKQEFTTSMRSNSLTGT